MTDFSINNLDANKRKQIPSWSDYSSYTTLENGKYVLKNGKNIILYIFKDKKDCNIKSQSIVNTLMNFYFQKQKEYETHMFLNPSFYLKTYEEANWTHKALINGFVANRDNFNPYENYFGVSISVSKELDPDVLLKRGNKHFILSLQGLAVPNPNNISEEIKVLFKNKAVKYIAFFIDNNPIYETFSGVLPGMDFIENFIKK